METAETPAAGSGFLAPKCLTVLQPLGHMVDLEEKQIHFMPVGDKHYVWLFLYGWGFGLRGETEGRQKTTALMEPGELLGISGFSRQYAHDVMVYALTPIRCLRIPTHAFLQACLSNQDLARELIQYMSGRYRRLLSELQHSVLLPLNTRIEHFMSEIELRLKSGLPVRKVRIPEEVVGWGVGAHPVSVSRALHRADRT